MPVAYKAFVSSTYEDLKHHRAFVIKALRAAGFAVDPMEDWTADADEPRRFSADRLDGCDLCVLLVARRRGFVPPGGTRSITQLEYDAAVARGTDVLPFLLDEEAPWQRRFEQLDDDLTRWREDLSTRHGRGVFGLDPDSVPIAPALTRWLMRRQRIAVEVGGDWLQLVSNLLGLPKNEPDTRAVAARLLPHALAAVEREYFGRDAAPAEAAAATPPVAPAVAAAPIRAALAHADSYLQDATARYERTCYIISPFGQKLRHDGTSVDFDRLYHDLLAPAIGAVSLPDGGSLVTVRADITLLSGFMPDTLLSYLDYSRLVVADVTLPNANVFYELGRRHRAQESGTVLIAQEDGIVPFDLANQAVVRYNTDSLASVYESRAKLAAVLQHTLSTSLTPSG